MRLTYDRKIRAFYVYSSSLQLDIYQLYVRGNGGGGPGGVLGPVIIISGSVSELCVFSIGDVSSGSSNARIEK